MANYMRVYVHKYGCDMEVYASTGARETDEVQIDVW